MDEVHEELGVINFSYSLVHLFLWAFAGWVSAAAQLGGDVTVTLWSIAAPHQ